MRRSRDPIVLTFVRDFPDRSAVVGGEQVRPLELFELLAERGVAAEVWCVAPTSVRTIGTVRVRRLPLPRWGWARELLSVPVSLLVLLVRRLGSRRVVLYQRVAGGVALKGRVPFVSEPGWLFFGVARRLRIDTWASMHDLSPEHELNSMRRAAAAGIKLSVAERERTQRLAAINTRVQRYSLARATVVTVVSESLRQQVTQRYGVFDDRIFVVRAGFNPEMLAEVNPWTPPIAKLWTVAYVGSRYDMQIGLLLEATRSMSDEIELLLAGRGMHEVGGATVQRCRIVDATYAEFASLAAQVDIWVVPIADDPYLHWGWHLKLPMNLATGRPVLLSDTDELQLSGLADLFFVANPNAQGLQERLRQIINNPEAAKEHGERAQAVAYRSMRWEDSFEAILRRLALGVSAL